ncbi:nephrin-like isoform X2 [Planococcus citri]
MKNPLLVIWYKYGYSAPIYSVDFRNRTLRNGNHWSPETVFGSRAYFNVEESILSIDRVKETDAGTYKCRIDYDKFPTKNYIVNLSVIVPPQELTIVDMSGSNIVMSSLSPVMEGQPLRLMCTAHGGRPAPRVFWWQNENIIDNQSEIILNNQVQNILHFEHLERKHHGSILKCEAVNGRSRNSISSVVVVNLYLKPLSVRLIGNNEIFSVGREYKIMCETFGSRPPANVTWWLKGTKINPSFVVTTTRSDQNFTTSILTFQPKVQHHKSKLTCKVTNSNIAGSTLIDSWHLNIQYAPVTRLELGRNLDKAGIKEGSDVYFDCIIDANPPAKKVYWTHNGGILVQNSARIIISNQTLVLQKITRKSAGNYSCIASNEEGENQSDPFYLDVKYEPICSASQQLVHGAIRHEKIEVTCQVDSNPVASSFIWKFNNSVIQTRDIHTFVASKMHSIATYQPKTELDYGTLLCWAKNELGIQSKPCVFHIVPAGKPDTPHNCSLSKLSESSYQISCESGFDGGLPQEFICEVHKNGTDRAVWNITNLRSPDFTITAIEHNIEYLIKVYSSNGKGRSSNYVELRIEPSYEMFEQHTRTVGLKNGVFFSLWTLTLCSVLIFLIFFLIILIISVIRLRRKHSEQKHKKAHAEVPATPIYSDDDHNPDIIPQIEENFNTSSRRQSSTSYSHPQPYQAEFSTYSVYTDTPSHTVYNYSSLPLQELQPTYCDSVVQWVEPKFPSRCNSQIIVNAVPNEVNTLHYHTYTQTPVIPHKESAV